jgi:hypothetical protein
MERGFIFDFTGESRGTVAQWMAGVPTKSFWSVRGPPLNARVVSHTGGDVIRPPALLTSQLSLIVLLIALDLGCGGEKKLEDLDEPLLWWEHSSGLCSAFVAIDGHGSVWLDQGCEASHFRP